MKTEILRVEGLRGMDQRFDAGPPSASLVRDMRRSADGAWRPCGGYGEARPGSSTGDAGLMRVRSMHWFSTGPGQRWLLFEQDSTVSGATELRLLSPASSGTSTLVLQTGRVSVEGPWQGTQYAQRGNWVYIVNGQDEPVRYDGWSLRRVGFPRRPPAPEVLQLTSFDVMPAAFGTPAPYVSPYQRGVGEVDSSDDQAWLYGWAVSWVNDLGQESPLSDITFARGVNPGGLTGTLLMVRLAIADAPKGVRGIRIWRTYNLEGVAGQGVASLSQADVYLHSEFTGASGFDYMDGTPDRELGLPFDRSAVGPFPRHARFVAFFKNTGFYAGQPEDPSALWFSAPGLVEQIPALNRIPIGDRDSGPITGMFPARNALVVTKARGVYLVKGSPVDGFFAEPMTEEEGNLAANCLREIPGLGLFMVSDEGPQVLIGALENTGTPTRIEYIGGPVADIWRDRVTKSALSRAVAEVNHVDRELWLSVPVDGSTSPTFGLVYHYETGDWSIRDQDWPITAMAEARDGSGAFYLGLDGKVSGGVHVYSPGFATKNGAAITPTYRSAWLEDSLRRRYLHVEWMVLNAGTPIQTAHLRDRILVAREAHEGAIDAADTEGVVEVWGSSLWDPQSSWEDYRPTRVRVSVADASVHAFAAQVSGDDLTLFRYDLHRPSTPSVADRKRIGAENG